MRDRLDAMNRARDVPQEHDGVVVSAVERDPREQTPISLRPPGEQRRLAIPRGRDHGRERQGRRAQPGDQVCLRDGAGPCQRRSQLDLDELEWKFGNGHPGQCYGGRRSRISSHLYDEDERAGSVRCAHKSP
jgi:hypothetical protein